MKKVSIVLIIIVLLEVLYGFLPIIIANAGIDTEHVFISSQKNIEALNANETELSSLELANKAFKEFSEDTIDKDGFYLRIDKIGLFKRIIENVDPRYKEEYVDSWNYGVSHGKFTSTPDKIGITYLFSHATGNKETAADQKAWFSYMDELLIGDEVIVYYKGNKYTYNVSELIIVDPSATGFYTGSSPVAKVRMQFCGPPTGSLAKRTLVDAILIDSIAI